MGGTYKRLFERQALGLIVETEADFSNQFGT
jgi:hypothetical protein